MNEEEINFDPELRIFNRFDQLRNHKFRKERNQEQIERFLKRDVISEAMARNFVELLDINPAYYWPRKYRYTLEPDAGKLNPLTIKQRNQFERNGYVLIRDLVSKNLINLITDCPRIAISEILPLVINQRELVNKAKAFCGENTKHIATMIIDNLYSQSVNSSNSIKNELNQDLTQLAQHFYQFNIHPADRLLGCLICTDNSNQLKICLEPATHQSSMLEIEMRGVDGELVKTIYEKPIRRLEQLNEIQHSDTRQIISLQPGDVLLYHPLLAQSILFEQTNETEIENLTLNLNESSQILALNVFYGSADLTRVIRSWGTRYAKSANFKTPLQRLNLLDKLLVENQNLKESNELLEQNQTDDLKSLNVQIFIGNSIVNLDQVLADAGQDKNFEIRSHL